MAADVISRLGGTKTFTNYQQNKERKESLFMMISSLTEHKTNTVALKFENFKHLKISPPSQTIRKVSILKKSKELLQLPPCSTNSKESCKITKTRTKEALTTSRPNKMQPDRVCGIKKRSIFEKRVFKK